MKRFIAITMLIICIFTLVSCGNAKEEVKLDKVADLSGKKVGVQNGTGYELDLLEKNPDVKIEYFSDPNIMILAAKQGKLDAYITDSAAFGPEKMNNPELVAMKEPVATYDLGVGIGKVPNQSELKAQIDEYIIKSKEDGTFDEMNEYWRDNYNPETCKTDKSNVPNINGVIRIGVEGGYEPYSYMSNGEIEGFDIDFMYRFCREYGYEPDIQPMDYDAISPALATGKIELGTNIVFSEEREEAIMFSEPYIRLDIITSYCPGGASNTSFIKTIQNSFNKTFVKESRYKMFLQGIGTTLLINVCAIAFGTILGFAVYLICRRGNKVANKITSFIVWLVHGTPTVVLLMIFYFVIFGSLDIEKVTTAIITFSLLFAAAMFDMLEGGEKAVGTGQLEAALSQGFTDTQAFFRIILPQSAKHFLPIYKGEVVSLIKETSIVGYIAIQDLTKMSDLVRSRTFEAFFPLISTAVIYFVIAWILTSFVKRVQISIDPQKRSTKKILKGIKIK